MLRERIAKISLPLILSLAIFSCNSVNSIGPNVNTLSTKITYSNGLANIDLANKNGTTLKFGINKSSFKLKAALPVQGMPNSLAGNNPKEYMDVKSYKVWLIKNSSPSYPAGGDPIGDSVAGVFEISSMLNGIDPVTGVSFNNVGTSNGDYYYMAVQAFDGELDIDGHVTGKSLIKQNNGSNVGWKGQSAYPENRIAVSNSVKVDDNNQVSSLTSLTVVPMLEDGFGATVNSQFKLAPNMDPRQVDKCGGITPESYISTIKDIPGAPIFDIELDPIDGSNYFLQTGLGILKKAQDGTLTTFISDPSITSMAIDPSGNMFYSTASNVIMKRLRGATTSSVYAGGGAAVGTPAQKSVFNSLSISNPIDFDSLGNLYVYTDSGSVNGVPVPSPFISKISLSGNISVFSQNRPDTSAFSVNSASLRISKSGYLYLNDGVGIYKYDLLSSVGTNVIVSAISSLTLDIDSNENVYFSDILGRLNRLDNGSIIPNVIINNGPPSLTPYNYIPVASITSTPIYSLKVDSADNLYLYNIVNPYINIIYNNCAYTESEAPFIPPV